MTEINERNEQIERIEKYEALMTDVAELIKEPEPTPYTYFKLRKLIRPLEAYYTSDDWKQDYADDEAGLLPIDLKRGVLSQDGIYNLLETFDELTADMMSVVMETERLILRAWTEDDAEACFDYAKDPRVGPVAGWPVHNDVEDSVQVIRDVLAVPETYAMVLKETGVPIGSIGLHFGSDISKEADEAELGYVLSPKYWGQGLVPEAGEEMLRHAFCDLGANKVWCAYYEGNDKSRRVQEKLGFKFSYYREDVINEQLGEVKNMYVSCLTREEWEER
ncbi:MAG: GNAT family N-acetyltransferase [Firmicutes bacterium]|nr:GNAT family N-acetyltransferase [Bacillota bacterium]